MELEYNEDPQQIEDDEHYPMHTRSMGYTDNEDFPSPSFGGFISVLIVMVIFAMVLAYGLPALTSLLSRLL